MITGSIGAGFGYNLDLLKLGSIAFANTTVTLTGMPCYRVRDGLCDCMEDFDPRNCTRTVSLLAWGKAKPLFGFSAFLAASYFPASCTICGIVCAQKPATVPQVQELAQVVVDYQQSPQAQIEQVRIEC
jgi:hypothetical protein